MAGPLVLAKDAYAKLPAYKTSKEARRDDDNGNLTVLSAQMKPIFY